jgi:hypothetical protein
MNIDGEICVCITAGRKNIMVQNRNTYVIKYTEKLERTVTKNDSELKLN